jgi:glycine/D-amino acid oxidase-like deaminating enzyme
MENLVFATGHFRNGILLAPVTAEVITDLILKGAASCAVEAYRPTRFRISGDRAIWESRDGSEVNPRESR